MRTVILIPGIRTGRNPMRGDRSASKKLGTDGERRRLMTSGAGAISDQKTGIAEIEGGFLRRADRRRHRADKRPENAAQIETSSRHLAARIGPAFPRPVTFRFRGGRSPRSTGTAGGVRADIPVLGRDMLMDRRRSGGNPDRWGRFRCRAAAADRRTRPGVRHRRAGYRRTARHQRRTHERRQGDPGETWLGEGNRHSSFQERPTGPLLIESDDSS